MKIINQHRELLLFRCDNMKLLIAIVLIVLMIGVTPAFAAISPADQQNAASMSVKDAGTDIGEQSQVTDQSDDTDDYIVIDPSNESDTSGEGGDYSDDSGDQLDEGGNYIVVAASDELDTEGENNGYIDELDDQLDDNGDYIVINSSAESDTAKDGNYIDDLDDNIDSDQLDNRGNYIARSSDVSNHPDESSNYAEEPADDQLDESSEYTITEVGAESEYIFESLDELDENLDNTTEALNDDQSSGSETISQIGINVHATHESLIVTLVDRLCGVVQSTLGGVDSICMVLANGLATIL